MRISETHWTGKGTMQRAEGETIIYSGRHDDNHREGTGILMSTNAARSLMEWTPISEELFKPDSIPDTSDLRSSIYMHTLKMQINRRQQDVFDSENEHDMLIVTAGADPGGVDWVASHAP